MTIKRVSNIDSLSYSCYFRSGDVAKINCAVYFLTQQCYMGTQYLKSDTELFRYWVIFTIGPLRNLYLHWGHFCLCDPCMPHQWFWRRKCHMGHCPHVMQNQWDKFESYGTFSRIILLLKKCIGYMLQLYPKYLNRCKTNELSCNLHKKRKNIILSCNKNFF